MSLYEVSFRATGLKFRRLIPAVLCCLIYVMAPAISEIPSELLKPPPVPERDVPGPDPSTASKPLDPWSVQPVKLQYQLAVLPFSTDGLESPEGRELQLSIQSHYSLFTPRMGSMVPGRLVRGVMEDTAEFRADEKIESSEKGKEALRKYTRATHLVSGTVAVRGDKLSIKAVFESPEGRFEKEFEVLKNEEIEAARQIVTWMADVSDLGFTAEEKLRLAEPLYGRVRGVEDYKKVTSAPDDPYLADALRLRPKDPVLLFVRLDAAVREKNLDRLKELDPGPLPEDASLAQHLVRLAIRQQLEDPGNVRHEMELIMAKYPGYCAGVMNWGFHSFGAGQKRDEYLGAMRRWRERAWQGPMVDVWLASAHIDAAWDYRGGGYAYTVPKSVVPSFLNNLEAAQQLIEPVLVECDYLPYPTSELCKAYGGTSKQDKMLAVAKQSAQRWPDARDVHSVVINFLRLRWGGSNELCVKYLDDLFQSRPDNIGFAWVASSYHWTESQLFWRQDRPLGEMMTYLEHYPQNREKLVEIARRLSRPEANGRDTAHALLIARSFEDPALTVEIVQRHPRSFEHVLDVVGDPWKGTTLRFTIWALCSVGNWRALQDAVVLAQKEDKRVIAGQKSAYMLAFPDQRTAFSYMGLTYVMLGDVKGGIPYISKFEHDWEKYAVHIFPKVVHDKHTPADVEYLQKVFVERPDDSDSAYLLAYVAIRDGDQEKARHYVREAERRTGPAWVYLRNEVDQLLNAK